MEKKTLVVLNMLFSFNILLFLYFSFRNRDFAYLTGAILFLVGLITMNKQQTINKRK
ncbi:MAG: hypothetical protein R6U02_00685 [Alkalibacterium sp.]|uniref:hypothetical protein n=1 Tax=Alkalibacterium sp. TaxID=1872447 RepID=UPI003970AC03